MAPYPIFPPHRSPHKDWKANLRTLAVASSLCFPHSRIRDVCDLGLPQLSSKAHEMGRLRIVRIDHLVHQEYMHSIKCILSANFFASMQKKSTTLHDFHQINMAHNRPRQNISCSPLMLLLRRKVLLHDGKFPLLRQTDSLICCSMT